MNLVICGTHVRRVEVALRGGGTAIERGNLRLADLKARRPDRTKLMNVKLPVDTLAAIDQLAKQLKASKTSVVAALLNETLAVAGKTGKR